MFFIGRQITIYMEKILFLSQQIFSVLKGPKENVELSGI